ncbi:MAG TPA: pitrilysin family protein, partial [Aggregatilineales bacterium]|nr:pitrilysin family protein [Aggregatilineales bacterium]
MTTKSNSPAVSAIPGSNDIAREVLPNGLIVLARENFASPSVIINGLIQVGSIFETPDSAGLANIVASALMRGTKTRDFDTLHETLESLGASLGIGGGVHTTSFSGKALAEDLRTLLELLSDALRNAAFPADQVERLRGEIQTYLKIRSQDTRSVASDAFRTLAYPSIHPYSHNLYGEPETVARLSLSELIGFHEQNFGPRGMILVIVGAVKTADAINLVRAAFEDWQNPTQPIPPTLPPTPRLNEIRQQAIVVPGKTQSDIVLGWPGPARAELDFQAANLANNILGVFGMMGRLGKTVREDQGLAYYCGSRLTGGIGPGPWQVTAGVNPANVQVAIDSIVAEVNRIVDSPVSDEELADNK